MKPLYLTLTILFGVIVCLSCCRRTTKSTPVQQHTVTNFDIDRYLGKWYEIARFDHSFEKGLVGVTAEYTRNPDGSIRVLNSGYKNSLDGPLKDIVGKAKQGNIQDPGKLKVSFFLFFYADYNVLYVDPEYQYALIGSSSPNYLWILSRTPVLSEEAKNLLLLKARMMGYDTDKLIWVKQK